MQLSLSDILRYTNAASLDRYSHWQYVLGFYILIENSLYLLADLKLFDRSIGLIFFIHFIRSFMILISIVQIVTYSVKISSHKPSILKLFKIICPMYVFLSWNSVIHLYKFNENWIFKLGEIKIPGMVLFNRK